MSILDPCSLETICRRRSKAAAEKRPCISGSIDRTRWFVCPTLSPLYYTPSYETLDEAQKKRYNQLTALCFNELIAFFEQNFASSVLAAIGNSKTRAVAPGLVDCLQGFWHDEQEHIGYWRSLNRLTAPHEYATSDQWIVRFSPVVLRGLKWLTARPFRFPAVFWIMLALEERSLEISRRCLALPADDLEPTYRKLYQHHLRDEVRHVELDRHLIEFFYAPLPLYWRRCNARLIAEMIGRFFLPPTRSAIRVARQLAAEFPSLAHRLPTWERELRAVSKNPRYVEMMYSRTTTPITFGMFDRFRELHRMRHVVTSYRPPPGEPVMS